MWDVNSDACTVPCTLRRWDLPKALSQASLNYHAKKGCLFIIIRLENECIFVVVGYLHRNCKIILCWFWGACLGFVFLVFYFWFCFSYAEVRAERRRDLGLEESSIELASSSLKVPRSFTAD